jgi:hypothetical protein
MISLMDRVVVLGVAFLEWDVEVVEEDEEDDEDEVIEEDEEEEDDEAEERGLRAARGRGC